MSKQRRERTLNWLLSRNSSWSPRRVRENKSLRSDVEVLVDYIHHEELNDRKQFRKREWSKYLRESDEEIRRLKDILSGLHNASEDFKDMRGNLTLTIQDLEVQIATGETDRKIMGALEAYREMAGHLDMLVRRFQ